MMSTKRLLPSKQDDPSAWYTTLIQLADLADYGPAKGTMIIKPYGYAIWENVVGAMDPLIKEHGVDNAYFPIFIPMSFLEKEKSHVEGFAPELAVVTIGGGEKLEEPLAVRPTSETIMYNSYAKWTQSYRDLPILMNQWNNVVRWEKRTMPFLRTSEFLWQEGHTAHATHQEATEMQQWAMEMYAKIYREYFAMDGYEGYKSQSERFAGADETLTFESLMPSSGKALQACTSHDLGQNFAKAFDIKFQDKEGGESFVWQTSWGFSTRSVGGLILSHGDENGLRLPPRLAPHQVVIVPVRVEDDIMKYCEIIASDLRKQGIRVKIDNRDDETFGFRLNKWEVKGAPVLLKIGAKEVTDKHITYKRRDSGAEETLPASEFIGSIQSLLDTIQSDLFKESQEHLRANTREAHSYDEFKELLQKHKGFIKVYWNDNPEVEKRIKDETKATSRCRPLCFEGEKPGKDFITGEEAHHIWLFAQSY